MPPDNPAGERDAGERRGLDSLLAPRSVAVVGASDRPGHFGSQPIANLQHNGFRGPIYPVNPNRTEVAGLSCYPDVGHLPEVPDLAVIVLPHVAAVEAVAACGESGIGAAVIVGSGFAESGDPERVRLQDEITAISRRTGIRVCGPNTLGVANWADGIVPLASGNIVPTPKVGSVAVVSQSGGLGFTIVNRAWAMDVGIGHLAVAGNEADVSIPELASWYLERPDVRTVVCYMESIRDAAALRRLGELSASVGKPVFVLKAGRTNEGQRAASAHTGALATSDDVCDAALRQWGLLRVDTLDGLLSAASLAARFDAPATGRVGVYCQGGGIAVVTADLFASRGIELAELARPTSEALTALLPDSNAGNPLDSGGQFLSQGPGPLTAALGHFDADPDVGIVVVMAMPVLGERAALYTIAIAAAAAASRVPYVAVPYTAGELTAPSEQRLRDAGVLVLEPPAAAIEGLGAWLRSSRSVRSPGRSGSHRDPSRRARAGALVDGWRRAGLTTVPEHEAINLLQIYGINVARQLLATDPASAAAAASAFDAPVVLKIASPDVAHRSDVGGVMLGVPRDRVEASYHELLRRVEDAVPDARIDGVAVVEMAPPGLELILGAHRDPTFGPVVVAGLGGVFAELLDDVALRLTPFDLEVASEMLGDLRHGAVLDGYRGSAAVDRDAIADLIVHIAELVDDFHGEIASVDLNPVIAYPKGREPITADALIELAPR